VTAAAGVSARRRHPRLEGARDFASKYLRRTDGVLGIAILLVFAVVALAPDLLAGPLQTATTATGARFGAPSATHILGTDNLGRDMLNLTIHGGRVSMTIGAIATLLTVLVGAIVGIVSGYVAGVLDTILMFVTNFFLVLPTFVLAIILAPIILDLVGADSEVAGVRSTLVVIAVVIGITSWASTARIIRSQTMSVRERMYVDRARVIGSGRLRIMRRHILPNVMNLIVANAVLTFAGAIFTETTLAFIGLGDPLAPSWGQLLNEAQGSGAPGLGAWWYIAPPAFCVVAVVLAFTLVGNALDDVMNPKASSGR
jgi:peptide/nickel transport system permease protein